MRALIVGGGIGGLSAGIALRNAGLEVRVFENAPELLEVGAAISLWSNAMRAARRLGVEDAVKRAGGEVRSGRICTWRGKALFSPPVAEVSAELGAPSICLPRASLQKALADALGPASLRLGARCTGMSQEKGRVVATFADGSREEGDVLVGADGIHSAVRELLFGPERARYSGSRCWRAVIPYRDPSLPAGEGLEAWGPRASFGMIRMDADRVYWFATRVAPEHSRDTHPKPEVQREFGSWIAPIPALIEATPEAAILQNDNVDRPTRRRWGEGRVTLLGDAIHPMTPHLGQGGCLAMEDAVVLADSLRGTGDPVAALRGYENRRRARCAWIVRESRNLGRMSVIANPVLRALRDLGIRMAPAWWMSGRYRALVNYPS